MKRFFNEDDNFFNNEEEEINNDLDEFDMDDEETFAAFISKQAIIEAMEGEIGEAALNQELLIVAVDLAKQRPFWNLRTLKNQTKIIENFFRLLLEIRNSTLKDE